MFVYQGIPFYSHDRFSICPTYPSLTKQNALTMPCNAHIGFNTSSLTSPSPMSFQVEWQEILHRCQVDVLAQFLMCGLENVAGGDHVP